MGDKQEPGRPVRSAMTLDRYLELASRLPLPTREQVEAFAAHIRHAHSWYKHLPILPPGRPFHFYLDPGAGMTRVVREDGQLGVVGRTDETRYHYSWFSTDETRERFGFLSYGVTYPQAVVRPHELPALLDPDLGIDVTVATQALEAARVDVSGLIHPLGTNPYIILLQARHIAPAWPVETGGSQQAAKVLERCRALVERQVPVLPAPQGAKIDDETRWAMTSCDWGLYELLAAERQRQQDALVDAALRAVSFVRNA